MNLLDVRTVVFSLLITDLLCTVVLVFLWHHARHRFAGIPWWVLQFLFQTIAMLLIVLRGSVPDWMSIVLANSLVMAGGLSGYVGLERFVARPGRQLHNGLLLAGFACVHAYFAFIQPNLAARTLNLSTGLLIISLQCAHLLWCRVPPGLRPVTRRLGLLFGAAGLLSIGRIVITLLHPHPDSDFFRSGTADALFLTAYQMFLILLAYGLTLMVNHRLLLEIQGQEEKFAKAFHSSPYALTLTQAADGRILEVNDGFTKIAGYTRAEAVGKTTLDLGLWPDEAERTSFVSELLKGNRIHEREIQFRSKSGDRITGLFSSELLMLDDQPWMLSSVSDITARKRAEETLRTRTRELEALRAIGTEITRELELDRLLRLILRRAAELVHAPAGTITLWDEAEHVLRPGVRFGEAFAAMPQRPVALGEGLIGQVAASRQGAIVNEYRSWPGARADGRTPASVTASLAEPLLYRDRFVGVLNVLHEAPGAGFTAADQALLRLFAAQAAIAIENARLFAAAQQEVAERRRAEESLRQSQEKYQRVVENAQEAIYVVQEDRIVFANAMMVRMLGVPAGKVVGTSLEAFLPVEERARVREHDRALARGERIQNPFEMRCMFREGEERWVSVNAVPLLWEGRPATLNLATDITPRRQAEAEREGLQTRLLQAQKMEAVGRLAGGIAHDFNNLLMGILNYVELCEMHLPAAVPGREYLAEIRAAAERSADLTRQILAFARKQTVAPKVLDLNDTVAGMLKMLRRLLGEQIDLVWRPGASLGPVRIDPSQVDQLLANLLVNARDAIPGTGTITIETANVSLDAAACAALPDLVPGPYVLLAVSDTGGGMDAATQAQLFEPYFTTKERGKGTGLGLAIVYGIVRQNGGGVTVHSEIGRGTTFRLYLPRCADPPATAFPGRTPDTPRARGETVLVVEDERAIRTTCGLFLAGLGYTVLTAATPEEALVLAGAHAGAIHLLLTDVVLPGMNGRELATRLGRARPDLKCLFMSGYTADAIAHHGVLDAGVRFLQKPFSRGELAVEVRAALDADAAPFPPRQ